MPKLDKAIDHEDDWTGVTDPKERRKRQNRLHQRSWRQRQEAQGRTGTRARMPGVHVMRIAKNEASRLQLPFEGSISSTKPTCFESTQLTSEYENLNYDLTWKDMPIDVHQNLGIKVALPLPTSLPVPLLCPNPRIPQSTKDLHTFIRDATKSISLSSALLSYTFPLTPDHKLITLVQYNVVRGLFTNINILSLQNHIQTDCGYGLNLIALPYMPTGYPANFNPTHIQLTVDHPVWIDTAPSPQFRDNLILHQNLYDADEFCDDLVGGLYEGFDDVEIRGMMLWGDPWFEDGWEMSDNFVKKWGFLLKGCARMIQSTNRWRELRGEEKLQLEPRCL